MSNDNNTYPEGIIGIIADCHDCDWRDENYNTALVTSRNHAKDFKHIVACEITRIKYFKGRRATER